MIGTKLGAFGIVGLLGEGGMGQVYCARDSRLQRDVALKLLPSPFASDPDRLARFQREAQLLAQLNHPKIASIYGLEESKPKALVLELAADLYRLSRAGRQGMGAVFWLPRSCDTENFRRGFRDGS